jgi:hypothetical protein
MRELERLIRELRKQLLPYHHEHDLDSGSRRWEVGEGEYLTSWIARQLEMCHEKNRCARRGRCAYYEYGDLAKRNYEICNEILLRLESGGISFSFSDDSGEADGKD